jgi:hypothetical protein
MYGENTIPATEYSMPEVIANPFETIKNDSQLKIMAKSIEIICGKRKMVIITPPAGSTPKIPKRIEIRKKK